MKDHEIIELYWARNESAITATTEKYGNYCHNVPFFVVFLFPRWWSVVFLRHSSPPF